MANEVEAYYFGCWQGPGHRYWTSGMRPEGQVTPFGYRLDWQGFAHSDTWIWLQSEGWTVIGRRDQTGDSRPGSHSTFAFHALYTLEEAEAEARRLFPEIFMRMEKK